MARLYYLNEDDVECVVEIPESGEPVVVGRLSSCQIVTKNITVSRRHAEITLRDGQFRYQDLGSSNGSYFRGQKIIERTLEDGDHVFAGNFDIRFEHTPVPQAEALYEEPQQEPEPPPLPVPQPHPVAQRPPEPPPLPQRQPEPEALFDEVEAAPEALRRNTPAEGVMVAWPEEEVAPQPVLQRPAPARPMATAQGFDGRDDQIRRLNVEIESLSATIRTLRAAGDQARTSDDAELVGLRDKVRNLEDEVQRLQEAEEQLSGAREHVAALEGRFVEERNQKAALAGEVERLNGTIEAKNREYQELFAKYSQRLGGDEATAALRKELESVSASLESAEAEARDLQSERDTARREVEELHARVHDELEELRRASAEELEGVRSEHARELEQAAEERAAVERKVERMQSEGDEGLRSLEDSVRDAGTLLGLADASVADLKDAILALQGRNEELQAASTDAESDADGLRGRIRELEDAQTARDKELEDARVEFRQYRSEKQDELSGLRATAAEFSAERFKELSDKLVALANENREVKSVLEDVSFIVGLGYQVEPEAVKREVKDLKSALQRQGEAEAELRKALAGVQEAEKRAAAEKADAERVRGEAEKARDAMRGELEGQASEMRKLRLYAEKFSQERYKELEQQVAKLEQECEELRTANRTYLKKVTTLLEEKASADKKLEETERKLFDDRAKKQLEEILDKLQKEKDELTARLKVYETHSGKLADEFSDRYGDWKTNLQIVTGITEDLQDELAQNPIALQTVTSLTKHLDLLREGSTELKKLLFEYRKALGLDAGRD
jgi:chromosome segregation ATPase